VSRVACRDETRHAYRYVMARTREACREYEWGMWHISYEWGAPLAFIRETWLIYMCDMTHVYVWHASFLCATCLIHTCHNSCIYVTWFVSLCVHKWDITHAYEWGVSHVWRSCLHVEMRVRHPLLHSYVPWLIYMCVTWPVSMCVYMNESFAPRNACAASLAHVKHGSFVCVRHQCVRHSELMYNMAHSYAWDISVWDIPSLCATWLIYMYEASACEAFLAHV